MDLNIDTAIFIGFLIINLVVGLSYGRNVKTIKDYALGGRDFSTATLVATITATYASGSGFIIKLSQIYSDGLYYLAASIGLSLCLLIVAYVFVPKMNKFLGDVSVAETMGSLYGNNVRIITAVAGTVTSIGYIAVQYKVFGSILSYFFSFPSYLAVIISGLIVTIYSAFGGIRAVTFTDVLQFLTFGFILPLIGLIIFNSNNITSTDIINLFSNPKFDYAQVFSLGNPKFWEMVPVFLFFLIPGLSPPYYQRIVIGTTISQVKRAFIISSILLMLLTLAIAWISLLIYAVNPNIEQGKLLGYIIDTYTYPGFKGLVIIAITAMSMSTADSFINSSSVLFAHDICKPLNVNLSSKKELLLSKIFAFATGIAAIFLALSSTNLLSIILNTQSFYMPIVTVSLMLSILGFHSTTKPVLIGMGAALITVICWKMLGIKMDCIVIAMAVNLVFLLGSHYLLKQQGGFIKTENSNYTSKRTPQFKRKITRILNTIRYSSFIEFCRKNSPTNELTYTGLGIYFIFYTFSTIYSTQVELMKENGRIILVIYQIMLVSGTMMATYPIWPSRIKKEIVVQVWWNIAIFYMLVLFSSFLVMVDNFGQLQFSIFTLNIVITALLAGWRISLFTIPTGFYLAIQFYKFYKGLEHIDFTLGTPQFIFMYSLVLIGGALIMFLRPKEEHQTLTEEKVDHLNGRVISQEQQVREALALRQEFICNISHEYHAPMVGISSMADVLANSYDKLTDKQRKEAIDIILKSSAKLEVFDANISSLSKLAKANYALNLKTIDFSDLVYERLELCRKFYEENKEDREFLLYIEEKVKITGDKYYLNQLLDNLIINAISYCQKGEIIIALKQTEVGLEFTISDEGIGIPTDELYKIFAEFIVSSRTYTIAGGRGVGLALCKRVTEVHGGTIKAESDGIKGARFTFVLPLQI